MSSGKELQKRNDNISIHLLEESDYNDRFSDLNANIVIIVLSIVAFIPAFLDSDFYDPIGRFIFSIVLGCSYGLMATYGTMWHERQSTWWSGTIYFVIQIATVMTLTFMNGNVNDNFWMLLLPLSGQAFSVGMWRGSISVSVIMLLIYSGILTFMNLDNLTPQFWRSIMSAVLGISSAMLFVMFFTYIAVREGQTRREMSILASDLKNANHRLAEYAAQVEELATTRERNRLAREIHDNLGHYLTVVNVQIEAARTMLEKDPSKSEDALSKAQRLTQEGLQSVRQSVSALRESPLGERPLSVAISDLMEETRTTGIQVSLTINGLEQPLSPKIALTLYRVVQEGLTNVRKHAQATAVAIQLDYTQPKNVSLSITDDGIGSEDPTGGFGLLGLRERIQLLEGSIQFQTESKNGFSILVTLPLDHEEAV